MKLSRTSLIDTVTAELDNRQAAADTWDIEVDKAEHAARIKWTRNNLAAWRDYRDTLTRLLRKSEPFTRDDLATTDTPKTFAFNRGSWGTSYDGKPRWHDGSHDLGARPRPNNDQLESLIEFLEVITDDEVTFESLVRAGFKDGVRQAFNIPN